VKSTVPTSQWRYFGSCTPTASPRRRIHGKKNWSGSGLSDSFDAVVPLSAEELANKIFDSAKDFCQGIAFLTTTLLF